MEVVHNVSAGVVVSGQSLLVRHLRRHHSGSYTCAATNLEGRNVSNALHLSVRCESLSLRSYSQHNLESRSFLLIAPRISCHQYSFALQMTALEGSICIRCSDT